MKFLESNNPQISITGRYEKTPYNSLRFSFPGISIKLRIKNACILARMQDFGVDGMNNHFNIIVDGEIQSVIKLSNEQKDISIFEKHDDNWHTIELFKRTESLVGECEFFGFLVDEDAIIETVEETKILIEFIGDSITCGYGIEANRASDEFKDSTENAWLSYASVAARALKARHTMICFSGKGVYRNWASEPFEGTNMSEIYLRTLAEKQDSKWDFSNQRPSIMVVNLGSNDFSPPHFADENLFTKAYSTFIKTIRENYGKDCFLFCVTGPVLVKSLGNKLNTYVKSIVDNENKNGDSRIFFFPLTRQDGKLGFGAQWHPNIAQSEINGIEVANFIRECTDLQIN
jgi:hypothetical protein